MKRLMKFIGIMLLVLCMLALGLSQWMSHDDRNRTADMASDAITAMTSAATRLTSDRKQYTVVVVNRVGVGRVVVEREIPMSVQAVVSVRGSGSLDHVCATMPRVRDAINTVIADRVGPKLRTGRTLAADELADDGDALRGVLNRLVEDNAIESVRLTLVSAFDAQESGCVDPNKPTTASVKH
jgi:hypothetical protein